MFFKKSLFPFIFFILVHVLMAIVISTLLSLLNGHLTFLVATTSLLLSLLIAKICVEKISFMTPPSPLYNRYKTQNKWLNGCLFLIYYGTLLFLIFTLGFYSFFILYEDEGSIRTLLLNNYGDLPLHIHFIRYIAEGASFYPNSPILAGQPLLYPLGMDMYAALWEAVGVPLAWHLRIVSFILGLCLIYMLNCWGGWLLVIAFFFNNPYLGFPIEPPVDPRLDWWKSFLLSLFIPQRGFQLAFSLGVLMLWQWKSFFMTSQWNATRAFGIFLLGVLPFIHFHTFLFILGFLGIQWVYQSKHVIHSRIVNYRMMDLPLSVFIASIIFVPLVFFLTGSGDKASALRFLNGWMSWGLETPIYYFYNAAPWAIFLIIGLIYKLYQWQLFKAPHLIYAILSFLLMNFVSVAYWEWDNIKILSWCFLLSIWSLQIMVKRFQLYRPWLASFNIIIFLVIIGAGVFHLNTYFYEGRHEIFNRSELDPIEYFVKKQPIDAIFATSADHNHPLAFYGRPLLIGHIGQLHSHGANYQDIQRVYDRLFIKDDSSQNEYGLNLGELLKQKGVSYIFYGKRERNHGLLPVDQSMELVFETDNIQIYALK